MSKATLKKAIKDMDRDNLAEIILELYEARPEAKEYLEFWVNPDPDKELERYKQKVSRLFFFSEGRLRKNPGLTEIKKHLRYFASLCMDHEKTADLMLFTLDMYQLWLSERRHVLSHKNKIEKLLSEAAIYIESHALESLYSLRIQRLTDEFGKLFEHGDRSTPRRWRTWRR